MSGDSRQWRGLKQRIVAVRECRFPILETASRWQATSCMRTEASIQVVGCNREYQKSIL